MQRMEGTARDTAENLVKVRIQETRAETPSGLSTGGLGCTGKAELSHRVRHIGS